MSDNATNPATNRAEAIKQRLLNPNQAIFGTMLPVGGDGPHLFENPLPRRADLAYQIATAQTAEANGYDYMLVPVGNWCPDPFVTAATLVQHTERLVFLVAVRPGLASPLAVARQVSTLDILSGGRLALNIVSGSAPTELVEEGEYPAKEARYRRTSQFVEVMQTFWRGQPFEFDGEFYRGRVHSIYETPLQVGGPSLWFSGASPAAEEAVARQADVLMTWGEPLAPLLERLDGMRTKTAGLGRRLIYNTVFLVTIRDTYQQAWNAARSLLDRADPQWLAAALAGRNASEATGLRRLLDLIPDGEGAPGVDPGQPGDVVLGSDIIAPHTWVGLTRLMGGNSILLFGTPEQVAQVLRGYLEAGISNFILRNHPVTDENVRIGQELLPLLRKLNIKPSE
jgi:alkanesulfonate monooxygenase